MDRVPSRINSQNREFKKLRRLLQRKRHIKIELCVTLSVKRLFQVGHVVQTRRSVVSLALTDHIKKLHQKGRCTCSTIIFPHSTNQMRCTCSTIIFPHSTNQVIGLWRCRCFGRCSPQILNSLKAWLN